MQQQNLKTDKKALVKMLVDFIKNLDYGTVITYESLQNLIGFDVRTDRGPMSSAINKLSRYHDKCLVSLRNLGYKILKHSEVSDVSQNLRTSAKRKFKKAETVLETVDLSKLSEDEKNKYIQEKIKNATLLNILKTVDDKKLLKQGDIKLRVPDKTELLQLILK